MSRHFESRRTHSGYAEISGGRAKKKTTRPCKTCGTDIDSRKQYCGPCYADRYEQNIAANRHKYKKAKP